MSVARTILLIEDDLVDVFLLARAVRLAGPQHNFRYVRDSIELLNYLNRRPPYTDPKNFPAPDLLFASQWTTQTDNYFVLQLVRLKPPFRELPIVVLLDTDDPERFQRATESPANACYVKESWRPRYPELVQQSLEQFLGDRYAAVKKGD